MSFTRALDPEDSAEVERLRRRLGPIRTERVEHLVVSRYILAEQPMDSPAFARDILQAMRDAAREGLSH